MWLIVLVIPASVVALTLGCRRHRQWRFIVFGAGGLMVLLLTVLAGHAFLGELWEKVFTVVGATLVAIAHILNFRQCKTADCAH